MPYIAIEDFKFGLDRRKARHAGIPGSLWDLQNAHITRGGEIERCKKFVSKYLLPTGQTKGFFGTSDSLYVFGSDNPDNVTVPAGVIYQWLPHPFNPGGASLTEILDSQPFNGVPYVSARYSDGTTWHFLNGALVLDQGLGRVQSGMTSYNDVAAQLATAVNIDGRYIAAVINGDTVSVQGKDATPFTFKTSAEGANQSVTATTVQTPSAPSADVPASAAFTISSASTGINSYAQFEVAGKSINGITHNGNDLLGGAISLSSNRFTVATAVTNRINSRTNLNGYSAQNISDGVVRVYAPFAAADLPNGTSLSISGGTLYNNAFTGGVFNGIYSIVINGVDILGGRVNNPNNVAALAANVASQIASYTSNPEYTATVSGQTITIKAVNQGASANGRTGVVNTQGTVSITGGSLSLSGGATGGVTTPQVTTFKLGNSFLVGARLGFELIRGIEVVAFGGTSGPSQPGSVLTLYKTKMYSGNGPFVDFTSVGAASIYNRDTAGVGIAGQGFINVSNQDEGMQDVTAIGRFGQQMAIFSDRTIQLWNMFADPANNAYDTTLDNTGTKARKSVIQYGNSDLFYLDVTGIRSVRARAGTNAAFSNDIGTAVDSFVQALVAALADGIVRRSQGTIEPYDGRYWLAIGDTIMVFSYFPSSKISAWSYYKPGFTPEAFVRIREKLYVRANDTIYLYGGDTGQVYPGTNELPVVFETPFLTAGKIATRKLIEGYDAGIENEWQCSARIDVNRPDVVVPIGVLNKITYNQPYVKAKAKASHVALRMVCARAGYAKISNLALHFQGEAEEAG